MSKTTDLKPCQIEALETLEWCDSYFHANHIVERVRCANCDRRAEVWLRVEIINPLVCERAKRELICKLCEGCKEVANDV